METDSRGNIDVDINKLNILDSKTGVYNSDYFYLRLNEEIKRTERYDLSFSFMQIGLRDRKELFEELEEEKGDIILEEMGYNIKDAIRGDVDIAGHIEKGLFAIILPETDIHGSYNLAKRIKKQLRRGLVRIKESENMKEDLAVNIGIIEVPEDADNSNLVIKIGKRAIRKSRKDSTGIGLIKELEDYPHKKRKKLLEDGEKEKDGDEKGNDYYLPFLQLISKEDTAETEQPGQDDVKILKELERKTLLYKIEFDGEAYSRAPINAFSAVKLLNQKRFIYIIDPTLKTAIPCVTPHFDLEIRDKVLSENIYPAGSVIYSYKELRDFNYYNKLIPSITSREVNQEEQRLWMILESLKGASAIDGKWIVDPNSPFDSLYMMVRRRYLFKTEDSPGIYYCDLYKDKNKGALYPIYPKCRLASFEALRLQKKNIPVELITEGGFKHIINNPVELSVFYQVEEV